MNPEDLSTSVIKRSETTKNKDEESDEEPVPFYNLILLCTGRCSSYLPEEDAIRDDKNITSRP